MTEGVTRSSRRSTDRVLLGRTAEIATAFLETLDDRPVVPPAGRDALLGALGGPLPQGGTPAVEVIEDLARTPNLGSSASPARAISDS